MSGGVSNLTARVRGSRLSRVGSGRVWSDCADPREMARLMKALVIAGQGKNATRRSLLLFLEIGFLVYSGRHVAHTRFAG